MKWSVYVAPLNQSEQQQEAVDVVGHIGVWKKHAVGLRSFREAHALARDAMSDGTCIAGIEPYQGSGRWLKNFIHYTPHVVVLRLPGKWPPPVNEQIMAEETALSIPPF